MPSWNGPWNATPSLSLRCAATWSADVLMRRGLFLLQNPSDGIDDAVADESGRGSSFLDKSLLGRPAGTNETSSSSEADRCFDILWTVTDRVRATEVKREVRRRSFV